MFLFCWILHSGEEWRIIFQNICSKAAFWSFLLTSRSSEGPIIEKSIRRVVSPAAHAKAALSPWKMLSMFLKGGCRGLRKVKSHVMKHSFGFSRNLSVQQWHLANWKNHQPAHSCTSFQYSIHICIDWPATSMSLDLIRIAHKSICLT